MNVLGILDIESTSLEPSTGHVIEVALALFDIKRASLIRSRSWLVKAPSEAVAASQHIHGISPELVERYGVPFDAVAKMVHAIVTKEVHVLTAHHAAFDMAWMPPYLQNAVPVVCSMDDCEWPRPSPSRGLTSVALAHGIGVVEAHRAGADVDTLVRLFTRAAELTDIEAMLTKAMRPKKKYRAVVSYETNALAKTAGFRFDPQAKMWWKTIVPADLPALALPFEVHEVSP